MHEGFEDGFISYFIFSIEKRVDFKEELLKS